MLAVTPLRIYNTSNSDKRPKHIRKRSNELTRLRQKVSKYEYQREKLRKLAEWNLRSTKSSLKDVQDTIKILEDLYGEDAFESP